MTRRHDLDWVRACAFGLLVLYHIGMYYVSWDWHVKSPQAGTALEPFMFLTSPWRLSLLFLVSGCATAFLLDRSRLLERSRGGFLGQRSWRLLVPLVFGMLVVVPPQSYFEVVERLPGGYHDGYLAFWGRYLRADDSFCRDGDCLRVPTWNHLWFVAYLWVYTVVIWLAAKLGPNVLQRLATRLQSPLSGAGLLWWPAIGLALVRALLVGRFESTHALFDDWYNHAQYFSVFALGFLIARADSVWERMQRLRWTALVLAAATYGFLAWYFGGGVGDAPPEALRWFQRAMWGLNQWAAIVAILGFARHFAPGDSPALRYLVPAVFPVYILHQTVIVWLSQTLKPLTLHPASEGVLLTLGTFALCFAGYEVIRRIAWLRPLFGLKRERASGGAALPEGQLALNARTSSDG